MADTFRTNFFRADDSTARAMARLRRFQGAMASMEPLNIMTEMGYVAALPLGSPPPMAAHPMRRTRAYFEEAEGSRSQAILENLMMIPKSSRRTPPSSEDYCDVRR